MPAKFCTQNVYTGLSKYGIHFVYKHFVYRSLLKCEIYFVYKHFVYVLYTKCTQKFVEIWDTFYIQTICIHFVYISSDLQKVYIINIMYTICIQNSYRMYTQIIVCKMDPLFQHIFDLFVVHFLVNHWKQLRLETCRLIMGGTYQIDGLLDYTLH